MGLILRILSRLILIIGLLLIIGGAAAPYFAGEGNKIDIIVPNAFNYTFEVTLQNQILVSVIGGVVLFLGIILLILEMDPVNIIKEYRNKKEIQSELNKMNKKLEDIKKLGSAEKSVFSKKTDSGSIIR